MKYYGTLMIKMFEILLIRSKFNYSMRTKYLCILRQGVAIVNRSRLRRARGSENLTSAPNVGGGRGEVDYPTDGGMCDL